MFLPSFSVLLSEVYLGNKGQVLSPAKGSLSFFPASSSSIFHVSTAEDNSDPSPLK